VSNIINDRSGSNPVVQTAPALRPLSVKKETFDAALAAWVARPQWVEA
jgi:hypothetical protein